MLNLYSILEVKEFSFTKETQPSLPTKYQGFVSKYKLQREKELVINYFSKAQGMSALGTFSFPLEQKNDNFEIYGLFSIEEVIETFDRVYKNNEDFKDIKILPIGYGSLDTMILLGVGEYNLEQIFLERSYQPDSLITKVANNILEFIASFEFILEEGIAADVELSQLYKNWGEDFWRVREE